MVKMMIIVVLVYGMCWLPIHIVTLIGDYDPSVYELEYIKLIWNASMWLSMSHAYSRGTNDGYDIKHQEWLFITIRIEFRINQ